MLTAAGRQHMDAIQTSRDDRTADAQTARVADDLTRLAPGDIVFAAAMTRAGEQRGGCVVEIYPNKQTRQPSKIKVVEYMHDELCDRCGATNSRRLKAVLWLVDADDITDIRPRTATGTLGWAQRLCRLAADQGFDKRGHDYWAWAGMLADQAGIIGGQK